MYPEGALNSERHLCPVGSRPGNRIQNALLTSNRSSKFVATALADCQEALGTPAGHKKETKHAMVALLRPSNLMMHNWFPPMRNRWLVNSFTVSHAAYLNCLLNLSGCSELLYTLTGYSAFSVNIKSKPIMWATRHTAISILPTTHLARSLRRLRWLIYRSFLQALGSWLKRKENTILNRLRS